jgi:hypothetical protein
LNAGACPVSPPVVPVVPRIRLEKCSKVAETLNSRFLLPRAAVLVSRFAGVPALLVLGMLSASFPLVYASALSVLLMLVLCRRLSTARRYLCLAPYLVVIADWGENLFLATVSGGYPDTLDGLIRIASVFTSLKWTLLALTLLLLFAAILVRLAGSLRAG